MTEERIRKTEIRFRIHRGSSIKYAGTDFPSWLTLENARKLVDYSRGESIYEYSMITMEPMWEIF